MVDKREDTETTETSADDLEAKLESLSDSGHKELEDIGDEQQAVLESEKKEEPTEDAPEESESSGDRPPEENADKDEGELEAQKEDDPDEVPDSNKAWKKMRVQNKELKQQLAELESKLAEVSTRIPEPIPELEQPKARPVDAFRYLNLVKNGEVTDRLQAIQIQNLAEQALREEVSSADIAEVITNARMNAYGDESEEILQLAQEYLPVANAREAREREEQSTKQVEFEQRRMQYQTELQQVVTEFPEFKDDSSNLSQFAIEWDKQFLGTFDANGRQIAKGSFPTEHAQYILAHPYLHATMVKQASDGSSARTGQDDSKLKEELDKVKQKLALYESPESGSGSPVSSTSRTKNTADDLLKTLEEMSAA